MTIEIPLSKTGKHAGKYVAIVDDIDADLAELNWSVKVDKHGCYAKRNPIQNKKRVEPKLHRVIMGRIEGHILDSSQWVDHINNNPLDNRRENLRIATPAESVMNTRKRSNNISGMKGVSWSNTRKRWIAQINANSKHYYIGQFKTKEEAKTAYDKFALELHKEFANLG